MGLVEQLVKECKKITLKAIVADIAASDYQCLYYASEEQIDKLIDQGKISEDISSIYQDYQEELRVMVNEFA